LEDVIHISGGCFKMDCKETEWEVQTGLIWLLKGTSGELLWPW
jgi:hypothetical protein